MSDVKWIKLQVDIFDNRKIKQIKAMPTGSDVLLMWFQLLCLAGRINDGGQVYITPEIPYTEKTLSTEFGIPIDTVKIGLTVFQQFGMIEIVDDFLRLSSWEKYQNADELERIKEQTRKRVARHREKKKLELTGTTQKDGKKMSNVTETLPVTQRNALEREEDIDLDKNIKLKSNIYNKNNINNIFLGRAENNSVFTLPLNTGEAHFISQEDVDEWSSLYPAVDVMQQLRNMKGWLDANPSKRKTKKGIRRFIVNWLSKEQDKGVRTLPSASSAKPVDPVSAMSAEEIKRILREG